MNRTFALAGLLLLPACDQWHLSINSDGLVFISVIDNQNVPGDRFRVRIRSFDGTTQTLGVPASGELSLTQSADESIELTLLAPEPCQVLGPNPRSVSVSTDNETRVSFDVRCG
jgi:hypothetical protein